MKKRLLTVLLAVCLVLALGTVTAMADDAVASVGGTEYSTLQGAIDAAEKAGSGTITLLRSVESEEITFDTSGEYILDLAGKTFTSNGDDIIEVKAGDFDLTIRNGRLWGPKAGTYGIYAYATNNDVTITLESVYLYATDQGLGVQGLNTNNNLIVRNSTVRCDGTAIYFPPISGDLVIEDSTITGVNNGIYVKGGNVTVSGNSRVSVTGQGNGVPDSAYTGGSGFPSTGIAIYAEGGYVASDGSPRPINVTIEGGTIESVKQVAVSEGHISETNEDVQKLEIVGGTFLTNNSKSDVEAYIPEGSVLKQDDNGAVVVDDDMTAVARVDGIGFTDLAKAIAAADDGDTVTLEEDEEIDTSLELKDGITLDLGGNTLTSTDDYTVVCATGASAEVINGNLTGGTNSTVYNNGTALTLNGVNITYSGSRCAIQNNTGSLTLVDCTVNGGSGGGIWDFGTKSSVKLTSSTVTGGYFAVYHNGSTAGFTLNAENSTLIGDSEDACAIYVSGSATNTAESAHGMNNIKLTNCTVTGPTGIEGKYTNMVLTNCDITATAEPNFEQNNNGTTALGFAVVSTDNSMEPNSPAPESDITINGGAYDGIVGLGQYEDIDNYEGFQESDYTVTGGSFANPLPSEYLDAGLDAELYSRSNSDTPYSYYSTVEKAMDAAQPGDIVTDLSTVTSATRYNVTFNYGNNDSETVSVSAGATITFTAPTRSGYEFRGWRDNSGELHKAGDVVTVNSDMTFTAVWSAINIPDTYDIEIADTANGSVDTSLSNASAGSTITITATPDSGYSVASVTVTGPDGRIDVVRVNATTYTFKMPAGDVTVRVTFTDSDALPFTDVSAGQWFYDAVAYVYTNGMMEGDSATTFNPDGTMTRAMFWAVLGRIDGATITGTNWADQARDWAMAEGVSDGTDPNGLVTREQMVTMLWRYAGEPESTVSLSAYTDAGSVSDWAETAMRWAIDEGIITGMTDTTLVPQGTATRAQCAAIFMRFDQM